MGGQVVREQRKSPACVAGEVVLLGGRGDGFDDAGDEALRYLVATKAREIVVRKLRGW
jgi:hypothetical protein